jgi:ankyrin repeat protein
MLACTKPDIDVIDILVKAGANLVQCNKDGWDSFHIAARYF